MKVHYFIPWYKLYKLLQPKFHHLFLLPFLFLHFCFKVTQVEPTLLSISVDASIDMIDSLGVKGGVVATYLDVEDDSAGFNFLLWLSPISSDL